MNRILQCLWTPLIFAALISTAVNALMLVSPIFMMQVYDRVIASGHLETLYALTGMAVMALVLLGAFEALRQQLLARAGEWLERTAGEYLIDASLARRLPAENAFQSIEAVKRFYCAQGVFTFLDAPWVFVFAAVLWWMHPWLGVVAIAGAVALGGVALATELISRRPLTESRTHQRETQAILAGALRNADAVSAMGMAGAIKQRWRDASHDSQKAQTSAAERAAAMAGAAKAIRLIVQSAVLAVGAVLVIDQQLSAGGMIAASILLGRCLAPIEQGVGAWKAFILARAGWRDLMRMDAGAPAPDAIALSAPAGRVEVDHVAYQIAENQAPILADLSIHFAPGEIVCLAGPSGGGKTTLTRLIVGAVEPSKGEIRLDGRSVTGWNRAQFGEEVGYLPQGVELLPGTLADNIRRFGDGPDDMVVAAAQAALVDDLIRALPDGYETRITHGAPPPLSAGQLQRVGLARALYGDPQLIVLDEPNANLDVEGERGLCDAVRAAARRGATVIVVSHRPALLKASDRVAILQNGRIAREGSADQILRPKPAAVAETVAKPITLRPAAAAANAL